MRRVQISAVILALLATPLAFVARGMVCQSSAGPLMCCAMHAGHSANAKLIVCHCSSKSGNHLPDFGLIAPIAPTAPEKFAALGAPDAVRQSVEISSQAPTQGFSVGPFNPPRA